MAWVYTALCIAVMVAVGDFHPIEIKQTNNTFVEEIVERSNSSQKDCFSVLREVCLGEFLQSSPGVKPSTCGMKTFYSCLEKALNATEECKSSKMAMNVVGEFLHHFNTLFIKPGVCPTHFERDEIEELFRNEQESLSSEGDYDEDDEHLGDYEDGSYDDEHSHDEDHFDTHDGPEDPMDEHYLSTVEPHLDVHDEEIDSSKKDERHPWYTIDDTTEQDDEVPHADRASHEESAPSVYPPEHVYRPYGHRVKEHDLDNLEGEIAPNDMAKKEKKGPYDLTEEELKKRRIEAVDVYAEDLSRKIAEKSPWWKSLAGFPSVSDLKPKLGVIRNPWIRMQSRDHSSSDDDENHDQ